MNLRRPARLLWALPNTAIGLPFLALARATGGRVRRVAGVLEAQGGLLPRLLRVLPIGARSGTAVTLGHVVLGSCADTLAVTRDHERVHVAQYERWGPLFLPAYAATSLWALVRGRDAYLDNPFEREARRIAGRSSTRKRFAPARGDPRRRERFSRPRER